MTPREHLCVLLSYLDDLKTAIEAMAKDVNDTEAYVNHFQGVRSEAECLLDFSDEVSLESPPDAMLTDGYIARVEELRTQLA